MKTPFRAGHGSREMNHFFSSVGTASWQAAADELRLRQQRLGTARERPDDFERVRDLAHQLNNWRTVELLLQGQAAMPEGPLTF